MKSPTKTIKSAATPANAVAPVAPAGPSEVGRAAGCSRQLAARLLGRGMSPDEIIARAARRREWLAMRAGHRNTRATGRGTPGDGESFVEAQRRKEVALADQREHVVAELRKDLVPKTEMEQWLRGVAAAASSVMLRVGPAVGKQLAVCSDPVACDLMLSTAIRNALDEVAAAALAMVVER